MKFLCVSDCTASAAIPRSSIKAFNHHDLQSPMPHIPSHIAALAKTLIEADIKPARVAIGEISLKLRKIKPNQQEQSSWQLLQGAHDYEVTIGDTPLRLSIQLFLNPRNHYRVFAFATTGMLFSVNFTTAEDAEGVISLTQRIRFGEGRNQDNEAAKSIRKAKARMLCDLLVRTGFTVTDNMEVELGTFSAKEQAFLDTTPEQFLLGFLGVALLKGHFQGNKGFQFACMPRFDETFQWKWSSSEKVRAELVPNKRGVSGERSIPAGLRYQVLERDRICRSCGRGPGQDGAQLHVDHIVPYSLGGLTVLDNLQVLCNRCNLGKGNRSSTRFAPPTI